MPRRHEAVEALLGGRLPHRVVDDVDASASGESLHRLEEVLLRVQDDLVGARLARERGLGLGAHGADHAGAAPLRHLHEEEAHAPRRRVHEAGVALLQREGARAEVVGGHALQHRGRGRVGAQARRDGHRAVGREEHVLGVGAEHVRPRDPVSLAEEGHARPHGGHDARALHARDERQRVRVEAGAVVDVDEVDAGRLHPDHDLPGSGRRDGHVGETQHVGPAKALDSNRLHGNTPALEPV